MPSGSFNIESDPSTFAAILLQNVIKIEKSKYNNKYTTSRNEWKIKTIGENMSRKADEINNIG